MSLKEFQEVVKKLVDSYPKNPHYIVPWTVVWFVYGNVICRIPMGEDKYDAYIEVEKIVRLYEGHLEHLKEKLRLLVTQNQCDIIDYIEFISDYLQNPTEDITISDIDMKDKEYIQTVYDEFGNFNFEELDSEADFDFLLPYVQPLLDCAK